MDLVPVREIILMEIGRMALSSALSVAWMFTVGYVAQQIADAVKQRSKS